QQYPVAVWPIGAISRDTAGKDITEMVDMHRAGAVAFSDGQHPVQHAGLMMRALLYVKTFGGVIINQPLDQSIAGHGQMHEGPISTSLGMLGIPALAEELMVERDLRLLAYTGSRLHVANLSTAAAVAKVRAAKAEGLQVTASVPVLNLLLDDGALADFDNNCKVLPPLRSASDREALIEGLVDGTIDVLSANHVPHVAEEKVLEFPYAAFGASGLETAFAVAQTALGDRLSPSRLVEKLAIAPRAILGLPARSIAVEQAADLTLFDPDYTWTPALSDIHSKGKNSPLIGRPLRGRPVAIFNRAQFWEIPN
ncbi:MAG: amidohydrolase family protein, partial [Lewinella sp.]|nr:amidohydrolase family protein [Lewinella sp.]